jgi:hypothetical protein
MNDDDVLDVINEAERMVWVTGWHLEEERVLRQLGGTSGLACGRLEPRSDVIQLVTYDGEHLGHVRREGPDGRDERWVAVQKDQARQVGIYASLDAAAQALAQACGKMTAETG